MADYNAISEISLLPIWAVNFNLGAGSIINFQNLEAGSTFSIDPITVPDNEGRTRVCAWDFAATIYVMQNNYRASSSTLLADLEAVRKASTVYTLLRLGKNDENLGSPHRIINATSSMDVWLNTHATMSYRFDYNERRPRVILTIRAIIDDLRSVQMDPGPIQIFI